ncbi:MAG: protein kinase [Cyanobacteriota/Melainabacteria group bacterium]|nr:protein kinase [Cyanobacteria bacterium HKST-UBA01]
MSIDQNSAGGGTAPRIIVDRYEVTSKLGEGGMGVVYKAWDPVLNQDVSIKLLKNIGNMEESAIRFQREAKAASHLTHANLATVLDFGATEDGTLYMVSKFIEGQTLAQRLRKEGALSLEKAISVFLQVADCMAYIHSKGILHRDLKSGNIIVWEEGEEIEAHVLDFGIAKLLEEHILEDDVTSAGTVLGSPMYMSPEQGLGKAVDFRSDIYSLGCMFYESITGSTPFKADTIFDVIKMHAEVQPSPFSAMIDRDDIPEDLEKLIYQMLSKKPEERPESMKQVVSKLEQISGDVKRKKLFKGKSSGRENLFASLFATQNSALGGSKAWIYIILVSLLFGTPALYFYLNNIQSKQHQKDNEMIERVNKNSIEVSTNFPAKELMKVDEDPHNQFLSYESLHPGYRRVHRNEGWKEKYDYERLKEFDYDFYLSGFDKDASKEELKEILSVDHLIGLNCYETKLDDGDLKTISAKKNLRLLEFTRVGPLTKAGLTNLAALPRLEILRLSECNLDDDCIKELSKLKNLESLDIDYNKAVTDKGIESLTHSKSKIASLSLKNLSITDDAIKTLSKLPALKELRLNNTAITDKSLKYLADSKIKALDIYGTKVSDIGLKYLSKSKTIKFICVSQCPLITKYGLRSFTQKTGCQPVSVIY